MKRAVHNKSRSELAAMRVQDLLQIIRKHNLHNAIRGYSKLRKGALVDKLMEYSSKRSTSKGSRPKKDKLTGKLVPGINDPLYKEGLVKGARRQFEQRYGRIVPVKKKERVFIDITGGKKRRRKKPERLTYGRR